MSWHISHFWLQCCATHFHKAHMLHNCWTDSGVEFNIFFAGIVCSCYYSTTLTTTQFNTYLTVIICYVWLDCCSTWIVNYSLGYCPTGQNDSQLVWLGSLVTAAIELPHYEWVPRVLASLLKFCPFGAVQFQSGINYCSSHTHPVVST